MKKSHKIVNDLKTAGLVAGLSFTLSACDGNKTGMDNHNNYVEISHKTDSILQQDSMYKVSLFVNDFSRQTIRKYHNANKNIVKKCTQKYVRRNIKDKFLYDFMLMTLQNESYATSYMGNVADCEYDYDNAAPDSEYISQIRHDYRWFNDVVMYLSGRYDDVQFLKTDFFKLINDKRALNAFNNNLKLIQKYQQLEKSSNTELVSKHTQVWNQQVQEQTKLKQR